MKLFKVEFVTNLISCAAGACCGTASAKSCAEDEFGDFFLISCPSFWCRFDFGTWTFVGLGGESLCEDKKNVLGLVPGGREVTGIVVRNYFPVW